MPIPCAILGTGPAALMAATVLTRAGVKPTLFERRPAPGWKLLVAGSSGLNVTYDCPEEELARHFSARSEEMRACLAQFGRKEWLQFLQELGEEPYVGSSRRYFVHSKTAALLLKAWTESLEKAGATFVHGEEWNGIEAGLRLQFRSGLSVEAQTAIFALGGGSWEAEMPHWPELFRGLGLKVQALEPANAGYSVAAPEGFFAAAEGKPVKGLKLRTTKGEKQGELMITHYGLEGTPVYTIGCPGPAHFDLKPDLAEDTLSFRLSQARGSVWQQVENGAKLSPGALALLKAFAPSGAWKNTATAAHTIKNLELELMAPRPLSESISSRGGIAWEELSESLEIKKLSGVFCAGEMIDWDAPTGGFLIQGCVSTGFVAAQGAVHHLKVKPGLG